ncbi:MAG TPA: flagellar assembly protein FliW, partial [Bryobacteraceae bacterium]
MPKVMTRNFGAIDYGAGDPFTFPEGLPGFPLETAFLPIEIPEQLPLVYLQSLRTPNLCFVGLPVNCIVQSYRLLPNGEEFERIGLAPDARPGSTMLCLALVCFGEDGTAAANLRAPIVINVEKRLGIQMIQSEDAY